MVDAGAHKYIESDEVHSSYCTINVYYRESGTSHQTYQFKSTIFPRDMLAHFSASVVRSFIDHW